MNNISVVAANKIAASSEYSVYSELKDFFQGIYLIKDLSSKTSATIVSYGERLSSIIVASLIKGAVWYLSLIHI